MIAIFSRGRIDTSAADIVVDGGAGYQSGTAGGGVRHLLLRADMIHAGCPQAIASSIPYLSFLNNLINIQITRMSRIKFTIWSIVFTIVSTIIMRTPHETAGVYPFFSSF